MSHHLAKNPAVYVSITGEQVLPPPAAALHCFGSSNKAVGHRLEVGFGVIQAEDQAARADSAQRQALCTQVVLEHPIVGRRPRVADDPDPIAKPMPAGADDGFAFRSSHPARLRTAGFRLTVLLPTLAPQEVGAEFIEDGTTDPADEEVDLARGRRVPRRAEKAPVAGCWCNLR
jgi:hypothetical protein